MGSNGKDELSLNVKERSGVLRSNNLMMFLMALLVLAGVAYGLDPRLRELKDADARLEKSMTVLIQQNQEQLKQNEKLINGVEKIAAYAAGMYRP
jgi:hypothetical protein